MGGFILNLGLMYDSHHQQCLKNRCFCEKELLTIDRTAIWFVDSTMSIVIKTFFLKPVAVFVRTFKKHIANYSINNTILYSIFILSIILIIINFSIILAIAINHSASAVKLYEFKISQKNSEYIKFIAGIILSVAGMTIYVLEKKLRTKKAKEKKKVKVEVE